ncbi:MAG: molecular chaperone DjlA [Caulobacteraceae bacterium]|nr:molecular chaperone DjlA [Caulobacteraceae bacterium]
MNLWRNIAGIAARRVDVADCADCPPGPPGADPAFSTAVTALGAKLSKADGRVDHNEFEAFSVAFPTDPASSANVRRLFDLARQTTAGFESYAKRLAKRYRRCPDLLEDVMDGLFHIAKADGAVTSDEIRYLEEVSTHFGFSPLVFRRLKATHLGAGQDDPYVVLNVAPDASDTELRSAWKQALLATHPDRLAALGLPADYADVAAAKASAINAAYSAATQERAALERA